MTIFDFMNDHLIVALLLGIIAGILISNLIDSLLEFCINRPLRAMNIRKHGWPPSHCDADGDFKQDDCDEN